MDFLGLQGEVSFSLVNRQKSGNSRDIRRSMDVANHHRLEEILFYSEL